MNFIRKTVSRDEDEGTGCSREDFQQGMRVIIVDGTNKGKSGFVTKVNRYKLTVKENLNDSRWMNPKFDQAKPFKRGMPKGMRAVIEREEKAEQEELSRVLSGDVHLETATNINRFNLTREAAGKQDEKLWNQIDVFLDVLTERMERLSLQERKIVITELQARLGNLDH